MFTGIIEETGRLLRATPFGRGRRLVIGCHTALEDVAEGDSIAINGVCLTVTAFDATSFSADAVEETMRKTTLGGLTTGTMVNLERALRAGGKLGGHYVQGHVDTVSRILSIEKRAESWFITFMLPELYRGNVIPVGSIAVDGISLTVADKQPTCFSVSVIPHSFASTAISGWKVGTEVNVEFDVLGKYVQSFLEEKKNAPSSLTSDRLRNLGY